MTCIHMSKILDLCLALVKGEGMDVVPTNTNQIAEITVHLLIQ